MIMEPSYTDQRRQYWLSSIIKWCEIRSGLSAGTELSLSPSPQVDITEAEAKPEVLEASQSALLHTLINCILLELAS